MVYLTGEEGRMQPNHAQGMAHNFMMGDADAARFRARVARFVAERATTIRKPRPQNRDAARRRLE